MPAKIGSRAARALWLTLPLAAFGPPASAQQVWTGGIDDLWTTDGNWASGTAPAGAINDMLIFGPEGGGGNFLILGANDAYTGISGLLFTGADGAYTISGSGSFTFDDGAGIENDSSFDQRIELDLVGTGAVLDLFADSGGITIDGNIDLSDAGGVDLVVRGDSGTTIEGVISGAGASIVKSDAGLLTLNGANTFDGGVLLGGGSIMLGDDAALGTGDLTLSADGMILSSSDARAIANDIVLGANMLTVAGSNDLALDGGISGAGILDVNFSGDATTLRLNGASTYSGGTTLRSGRIVLGDDNALGTGSLTVDMGTLASDDDARAVANNIVTNGSLTVDGDFDLELSGDISGDGSVTKRGAGTLTLGGTGTYGGSTTIAEGTLRVTGALADTTAVNVQADGTLDLADDDETIGSLRGAGNVLLGAATLTVGDDTERTFSGVISGTGGLTFDGEGMLILAGENTFTGLTSVLDGILSIDGSVAGDALADGGVLMGGGRIEGSLTNADGATVAPGGSIGTLEVGGDYTQQSGGTLAVEFDPGSGEVDLLRVEGTATLEAGSTVSASLTGSGFVRTGELFTIIEADGGVFDDGAEIVSESATVQFTVIRDKDFENGDTSYRIQTFRAADAYADAAIGGNNIAIGMALDSLVDLAEFDVDSEAASLLGQLDGLDSDDYNAAVRELSPASYNAQTLLDIEASRIFHTIQTDYFNQRRASKNRLSRPQRLADASFAEVSFGSLGAASTAGLALAAQPVEPRPRISAFQADNRFGVYVKGFGLFSQVDTDNDRNGFNGDVYGGQLGADFRITDDLLLGAVFGYTYGELDLAESLGDSEVNTWRVGPYLSMDLDALYVDASVTFGSSDYEANRDMPMLDRNADADFDGDDISGFVGLGYRFDIINDWTIEPTASVHYAKFDYDGFTESGAGGADLVVDDRDTDSLRSRLGMHVALGSVGPRTTVIPEFSIGWEHEYLDNDDIDAAFRVGGNPFSVATGSRIENLLYIGAGFSIFHRGWLSGHLRYEGVIDGNENAHAVVGGLTLRF